MLKQETKVTVNEKIKHLADAIYNVRSNWRYTTRIVIAGDTVRIYIVGRNFHIACIRVDTTKLEDKAKKSNDVTLRYHMKHDDLVFRMIETNDEYKVLNTITQLLIECPDPVVHDDEGFQVMIPAKSFYGRKFRPNHKKNIRDKVHDAIGSKHQVHIMADTADGLIPTERAVDYAESIALSIMIEGINVNVLHDMHYNADNLVTIREAELLYSVRKNFERAKINVEDTEIGEMIVYCNSITTARYRRHDQFYDEYEF